MASLVVLCVDGSDLSLQAVASGAAVVAPDADRVLVTVVEEADPVLVTGTGMAGGVMTADEFDRQEAAVLANATDVLAAAQASLGLEGARTQVLRGDPANAICEYAEAEGASAIVIGSRGHGGIKRAVLGSVSDHIVRHAPCAVIVTSHH